MKKNSRYVNRRKLHLFYILSTPFVMYASFMGLRSAAADATEILSPLPDNIEYTVARDVVIVEKPVYEIPQETKDIIQTVFGDLAKEAEAVMMCESGGNPKAINKNTNGSIDVGLMQINSIHGVSRRFLEDPVINMLVAKEIYDGRGNWSAWVCAGKLGL